MTASVTTHGGSCDVLGGLFGYLVQGVLFSLVVGILVAKWWFESPRRDALIFLFDGSKQMIGATVIHGWNMVLAIVFGNYLPGDECSWYWANIVIDCTIGIVITYVLLRSSETLFGYDSGDYRRVTAAITSVGASSATEGGEGGSENVPLIHDTPAGKASAASLSAAPTPQGSSLCGVSLQDIKWRKYLSQLVVWCTIVTVMKFAVAYLMWQFASLWLVLAAFFLSPVDGHRRTKLVFVMVVTPFVMNILQFVVQDTFLKYSDAHHAARMARQG